MLRHLDILIQIVTRHDVVKQWSGMIRYLLEKINPRVEKKLSPGGGRRSWEELII